jgi:hypothetical protein
MASRAQTETLGFVLAFAIITASIGLVYTTGFSGLNEAREFEEVNNAERAFEVLADNIGDIVHWNAPSRSTEVRLAGSSLSIAEANTIRVNASGIGLNETYGVRPIIFDADTGERIIYFQGSVIRESGADAIVVRESSMLITENRTVLPVLQTRLTGTGSVAGQTTVLIRTRQATTNIVLEDENPPSPIWFNVTSPWTNAWIDHMESKSGVVDRFAVDVLSLIYC